MKIKCLLCNDIIEGDKKGTFIKCKCGKCSIDENEYGIIQINGDFNNIAEIKDGREIVLKLNYNDTKIFDFNAKKPKRIDKVNYYLNIAETVAQRSTCLKRNYGSVIVKNDSILSTGFNGAPRGVKSCLELGHCNREHSERGMDYSLCMAVHSEQNAIIHASRDQMLGSDLYLVGIQKGGEAISYVNNAEPCSLCKRMIINAGIKTVYVRVDELNYIEIDVNKEWVKNPEKLTGGY